MSEDAQLIRRLEALGRSESPALSSERLASIESSTLAAIDRAPVPSATVAPQRRLVPILVAVAAVWVVFVAVAAWFNAADTLTLDAAQGSVVLELPDGRSIDAAAGIDVPDGATVVIGVGGSARVGDLDLGPGRYLVRGDQLVPAPPIDRTTTTTTHPADEADLGGPGPAEGVRPSSTSTTATTSPQPDGPRRSTTTTATDRPEFRPTTTLRPRLPTTTTPPRDQPTTTVFRPSTTTSVPADRPPRTTTTTSTIVPTTTTTTTVASDRGG